MGLPEVKVGFSDMSSHDSLEHRVFCFAASGSSRLPSEIFSTGTDNERFLFGKAKQGEVVFDFCHIFH